MDGPAQYLQWGFIQISLANLIVIGLMIVVFTIAVVIRRRERNRLSTIEAAQQVNDKVDQKTEVKL